MEEMGTTIKNMTHEKCMNISAETGAKVKYLARTDDKDDLFEAGKNAMKYLQKGRIYTVKQTYGYDWLTFVELQEFPGVLFYTMDFTDC